MIVHHNLQNRKKKRKKNYEKISNVSLDTYTHFNRREFRRKSHVTLESLEKCRKRREEETASVYVALTKNQDSTWRNSYFRRVSLQSMLLIYETINIYQFVTISFFFYFFFFFFCLSPFLCMLLYTQHVITYIYSFYIISIYISKTVIDCDVTFLTLDLYFVHRLDVGILINS